MCNRSNLDIIHSFDHSTSMKRILERNSDSRGSSSHRYGQSEDKQRDGFHGLNPDARVRHSHRKQADDDSTPQRLDTSTAWRLEHATKTSGTPYLEEICQALVWAGLKRAVAVDELHGSTAGKRIGTTRMLRQWSVPGYSSHTASNGNYYKSLILRHTDSPRIPNRNRRSLRFRTVRCTNSLQV